jgi:hypothetical protein
MEQKHHPIDIVIVILTMKLSRCVYSNNYLKLDPSVGTEHESCVICYICHAAHTIPPSLCSQVCCVNTERNVLHVKKFNTSCHIRNKYC